MLSWSHEKHLGADTSGSSGPYQSTRQTSWPSLTTGFALRCRKSRSCVPISLVVQSASAFSGGGEDVKGEPRERDLSHSETSIPSGYRKSLLPDGRRAIWPKAVSRNRAVMFWHWHDNRSMLFFSRHEALTNIRLNLGSSRMSGG